MEYEIEQLRLVAKQEEDFWVESNGGLYPSIHVVGEESWLLKVHWDKDLCIGGESGTFRRRVTTNAQGITGFVKWVAAVRGKPIVNSFKIHLCNRTPCEVLVKSNFTQSDVLHVIKWTSRQMPLWRLLQGRPHMRTARTW